MTANLEWRAEVEIVSVEPGWASVVSPAQSLTGSGQAVFSIAENTTEEARVATLRVVSATDPELFGELTVTQLRAPAQYNLTIAGMDGTLPLGNASLLIAPASGENLTRFGSIAVIDSNTSISYDEALPAGEYTLVSVTPEGSSSIYLGGRFTIGEESVCTEMEHWYGRLRVLRRRIGRASHPDRQARTLVGTCRLRSTKEPTMPDSIFFRRLIFHCRNSATGSASARRPASSRASTTAAERMSPGLPSPLPGRRVSTA